MGLRRLVSALLLFATVFMVGCTSAKKPELRSVSVNFTIKVKDPMLKQLTTATEQIEILASGEFAPGTYLVRNIPVTITPGTKFRFALNLPIDNPNELSIGKASGQLDTTQPLLMRGVAMPQALKLDHGKMSGEIDLVRIMGSFFFNLLQFQSPDQTEGGDIQQMIGNMHIASANLKLRPDSTMHLGKNQLHVGARSSVTLTDLSVDKNLDYHGLCKFKINFAPGSAYIGEKVDTVFNGGFLDDSVAVERKNHVLTLSPLPKHPAPKLTLNDCTYKFGRAKTSSAHCRTSLITVNKFDWANYEDDSIPSTYHVDARMALSETHLLLDFPTYSIDALFPNPETTSLQLYSDKSGHGLDFATQTATAKTADIKIIRPKTSIELALTDTKLGSIDFTKSGDLTFELAEGTSGLRSFLWSNGKRMFKLVTSGGSTISITEGMAMALNKDHPGAKMQGSIPLSVKLGNAQLSNSQGAVFDLTKLNGQVTVDLVGEVEMSGNAEFSIAQCQLLDDIPAEVKVKGFKLTSGENAAMSLNGCSIVVPKGVIASMLKKQLPEEKSFDLNKEIFEDKKWRYKHGMITKLIVRNPVVESLSLTASNKATFKVSADIEVDGTVEKAGLLATLAKDVKKWDTKPWTATCPCSGTGTLTFNLLPNKTLVDSDLQYDVDLEMPLPQNIEVDWKKVSGGLICTVETSVISSYLNKCEPFHGTRTVPLDHKGTFKLFADKSKLQAVKISRFTLKPIAAGTQVDFFGEASL